MEPTLTTNAIDIVRHYVVRAIDEESLRGTDNNSCIEQLREYCTDVKRSDRFVLINGVREIHEVYRSITTTEYMKDFIHQGAAFLVLSMGENSYLQMVKDLSNSIIRGYWTSERQSTVASEIGMVLIDNPWLVFCILSRYAWFAEPKAEK